MSNAVDSVAKTYISKGDVREGILNRVEAAIRAYDPCLSCSTHAIGQMPIKIKILDTTGAVVKELVRNA
jgi:NAD-reducing hydrogenase large subunit